MHTHTHTLALVLTTARTGYVVPILGWASSWQQDWWSSWQLGHQPYLHSCTVPSVQWGTHLWAWINSLECTHDHSEKDLELPSSKKCNGSKYWDVTTCFYAFADIPRSLEFYYGKSYIFYRYKEMGKATCSTYCIRMYSCSADTAIFQ